MAPFFGDKHIFIYLGYHFRVIDAFITNFHLAESTLIMLVSIFTGYRHILVAYRAAASQVCRFSSPLHEPTAAESRD